MNLEEFRQRYRYNPDTDLIGKGGFAKVYKAYDSIMSREVALKLYYGEQGEKYDVLSELKKMASLSHPNLIRYYDATLLDSKSIYDADAKVQVGILEYANSGDFNDFIKTYPEIPEIKTVVKGMFQGLSHLHKQGVVHRDIKPQNILMHRKNGTITCKIADFGLAKNVNQGMHSSKLLGTMEYMAPEQFDTKKYGINGQLGTNVDLWSVGIILFELFTGELPFGNRNDGVSHEQMMFSIMKNELPETFDEIIQPYRDIISRCLVKNANDRIQTADQLIDLIEGRKSKTVNQQLKSEIRAKAGPAKKFDKKPFKGFARFLLFIANIVFTPILGFFLYLIWKKNKPYKAAQAANTAWWALASVLFILLVVVLGLIMMEYNLLHRLTGQ